MKKPIYIETPLKSLSCVFNVGHALLPETKVQSIPLSFHWCGDYFYQNVNRNQYNDRSLCDRINNLT